MRERDALPAVLVARHLRDDLRGDVAGGGEGMRTLNERAGDDRAVLQHVLQIHKVAVVHVLGIIVRVVEVDDALLVRLDDVLGQEDAVGQVAADLARHVVALRGVDDGVLVAVFLLGFLVVALDEGEDLVVRRVALAHERAGVAVGDVALGDLKRAVRHDLMLDEVLDLFDRGGAAQPLAGQLHALGDALDLDRRHARVLLCGGVCLGDGGDDLDDVELDLRAVSFDDLHGWQLSLTLKYPIKSILQHNILWQLTVCISNYGILSRTMQEVFEIFSQYLVVDENKYRLNVVELP